MLYYKYIGFCGEIYPFIHLNVDKMIKKNKNVIYKNLSESYYYNIDDLEFYLKNNFIPLDEIKEDTKYNYYSCYDSFKKKIKNFFLYEVKNMKNIFLKDKVAYFLIDQYFCKSDFNRYDTKHKCITYPVLKSYKFIKVKEAMQAFQEVSMYIGALDLGENKFVKIDDKYLAKGKGFDKYSFKKAPTKNRC